MILSQNSDLLSQDDQCCKEELHVIFVVYVDFVSKETMRSFEQHLHADKSCNQGT